MKLGPAHYLPPDPGRGACAALQARLTGAAAPTLADLEGAALAALQAAGLPFDALDPGAGFKRHPRRDHAHLWVIANAGIGTTGRPWLQVSAGNPKEAGGVDTATFTWASWKDHEGAGLSPAETAEARAQIEAQTQAAQTWRIEAHEKARTQAAKEWEAATPEGASGHPYLARKGVGAYGVRVAGGWLLVPVRDAAGTIHSLQRIGPDGAKRFIGGGEVAGHYHLIGEPAPAGSLYLAEGYATAATIHEATGAPVAAAFNCGNLATVAKVLRVAYPRTALTVAGDNDLWTPGNPGATHARSAAETVGAGLVLPSFRDTASHPTDFNDLAQAEGAEAVRARLAGEIERPDQGTRPLIRNPPPVVATPPGTASPATGVTLIDAGAIALRPVEWLWDGWLARGKVHVLAGAPGTGKTTAALALAATLTVGGRWPDGTQAPRGRVLIWSGEDDPADTLVPRLAAAGADLSRVAFVASYTDERGPRSFDPASDAAALSDHLANMDDPPALLIVDPIVSAVSADSHKNAEVRRALQPLVDLAQTRQCAILGISHFTKGTQGRDPTERVTGSLAFGALARVVLVTAKRPEEDGGGRILARAKSNLGGDAGGFLYEIQPIELSSHPGITATRVLWGEALAGTARELLGQAENQADPDEQGALADAKGFLLAILADGPVSAKQIKREADEAGHSQITLKRAKQALGVEAIKDGFKAGWTWALPPKGIKKPEGDHSPGCDPLCADLIPLACSPGEADQGAGEESHHKNMSPFGKNDPLRELAPFGGTLDVEVEL